MLGYVAPSVCGCRVNKYYSGERLAGDVSLRQYVHRLSQIQIPIYLEDVLLFALPYLGCR